MAFEAGCEPEGFIFVEGVAPTDGIFCGMPTVQGERLGKGAEGFSFFLSHEAVALRAF